LSETPTSVTTPSYAELIERGAGVVWTHDLEGRILWASPPAGRLLGRSPKDLVDRNLADVVADKIRLAVYLKRIGKDGEAQGRVEVVCASGQSRYLQYSNTLVKSEGGAPPYVLGFAVDVTDVLRSAHEVAAAKQHLERMLAAGPTVVYSTDAVPDYVATYVSPNVFDTTGYGPHEFERRGFWVDKIHPDDRSRVLEDLKHLHEYGRHSHEYRFLHADGTYRWMRGRQALIRDENGDPVAIAGQWTDLTEAKRASDEVDGFFEIGLDLLCIRTLDGGFKRINPAFSEVLGYAEEELLSRPISTFMHPADTATTETQLATLGRGRGRISFEDRWRCKDGSERTLAWSAVLSEDGTQIYATARDVTAEKEREAELRAAMHLAEEANTAKSEFLANMSHEIRTPMNGVIGMTELTLDTNLTDQQREYLLMVQASAGALLETINSILDFSKIEAGKLELEEIDFTLWETVTGALKPLALTARNKGVELIYDEGPDVPERLRGDPGRLRQALVNLVGNAVKFTEEGVVRLSVQRARATGEDVRIHFAITDTGIGIPSEKRDHIFGSFNQVDGSMSRRFGGTGLGLAITSGIVQMMGGQVDVDSTPGKGSTFSFTASFREALEQQARRARPEGNLTGLRVIAVDDHDANLRVLAEFTARLGMETSVANSGTEALRLLEEAYDAGAPVDLALIDCHMPGMGGFELAEHIRNDERFRDVVMVAFTAAGQPGDGARCAELGIASYLLKPLAPAELRDALLLTLATGRVDVDEQRLVTRHSLREARLSLNVLLAEDNRVNQQLATHILERFGHDVTLATTGAEVLALTEADQHFDVILMDIQMPEMDGIEATRLLREREARTDTHVPIVAMTAHAMVGDRERFLEAGMDDYVSKPISRDRLREVLRGIGRSQPSSSDPSPEDPVAEADESETSFDRDVLMEHTASDGELIRTLVEVFEADRSKLLGDIETALDGGDEDALHRAAHTIKGALGVFGAEPARARAERLEQAARKGLVSDGQAQYDELAAQVNGLLVDLRALVDELEI